MSVRRAIGIGILAFLLPFLWHTGRQWWEWIRSPEAEKEASCEYNLKALWLLSRKVSHLYRFPFPPPFKAVKAYVEKRPSILMTRQIAEYLGLGKLKGAYWTFDAILVCAKDPKYLLKMAQMAQDLDYHPSYQWHPDAKTLAYCPYCRLAVLMHGKLEKR
ncbi:MAG: hypothetical protein IMHGJWDQ_001100 [Candidatus Fervidibacter sp.]